MIGDSRVQGQNIEANTLQAVMKSLINMQLMAAACDREGLFCVCESGDFLLYIPTHLCLKASRAEFPNRAVLTLLIKFVV